MALLFPKRRRWRIQLLKSLTFILPMFCLFLLLRSATVQVSSFANRPASPFYRTNHSVDCRKVFDSDSMEIAAAKTEKFPAQTLMDLWKVYGDCDSVKARYFYSSAPLTEAEEAFPLAYAILAYDHLEQLELLLNAIYMPQNLYCFHIDLKVPFLFHNALNRLAKCFPNIVFSEQSFPIHGTGSNMAKAFYSCLKVLDSSRSNWKYVFTLQNHDFPLKSNAELVEILRLHDGANDVELLRSAEGRYARKWRQVFDEQGFPIGQKQTNQRNPPPPGHLTIYKGSTAATLSRKFVHVIVNSPVVQEFLSWLDDATMSDELFWSTLNHDEIFGAPGGYPGRCIHAVVGNQAKTWVSRFSVWSSYRHLKCAGRWRNTVCLFSLADLPMLVRRPELFLNKFWPSYDRRPMYCMHERLFNRTYIPELYIDDFNRTFYENLPAVQFQKWKQKNPERSSNDFVCQVCSNCNH